MFLGLSPQQQEAEVWKWLLYELVAVDRRNSLEGLGCLGFSLVQPAGWAPPKPLRDWGLDENEVWTLYQLLLDGFRTKGAVQFPDTVDPESEFFAPRNREYYFRGDGTDARRHISSWVPSAKGGMNVRLDLLMRLRHLLGLDAARQMSCETLIAFWARGLALNDATKCWHEYFAAQSWPGEGVAYRIRPDYWELRTHHVDPAVQWYQCDRCQRVTLHNLRGLCPTYRCTGRLHPCAPEDAFKDNHYRNLYTQLVPRNMTVKEHTAQLTSVAAAELQTQFIQGTVNVLSCSTTFELGVDVGELEAVFMRNVPPTAANYLQRAGRAGRRTSSTAFAVTFAQRRSHDLHFFDHPHAMVDGHVAAPTAVSMIHAGVLMKLGAFAALRVGVQLLPEGAKAHLPWIVFLTLINVVYGALIAMRQRDFKYVIGFSSVSHMGLVSMGFATMNLTGMTGAGLQMFSHGIMTALFFACVGMVYDRAHTRDIPSLGGFVQKLPWVAVAFIIGGFVSMGMPGLSGFVAEFPIFVGLWDGPNFAPAASWRTMALAVADILRHRRAQSARFRAVSSSMPLLCVCASAGSMRGTMWPICPCPVNTVRKRLVWKPRAAPSTIVPTAS